MRSVFRLMQSVGVVAVLGGAAAPVARSAQLTAHGPQLKAHSPQPAAPAVLAWSPGITRDVPPDAPLTIIFNRPMDHASVAVSCQLSSVSSSALKTQNSKLKTPQPTANSEQRTAVTWSGTAVTLWPALRAGSVYRLSIGAGARGANGVPMARPFAVTFATGDALRVVSVTPPPGTQRVSATGLISIAFNHPMVALAGATAPAANPAGWNLSIRPYVAGHGSWLGTSTWVFRPDHGLDPSTRYMVSLAGTARDAWGEALGGAGRVWSFRTDTPELYSRSPRDRTIFADPHGPIEVTFNQAMDRASTDRAFSLRLAGGAVVRGAITWRGTTLIFRPFGMLSSRLPYRVTVAGWALAANRRATLGRTASWSFHAAPAPRFLSSDPAPRGISWDLSSNAWADTLRPGDSYSVSLLFNTPMSKASLDHHLRILPAISQVDTQLYQSGSHHFQYTIDGDFTPSRTYTVSLAPGVRDQFGRPLPSAVSLPFRTSRIAPALALYGMPGMAGAISFSAGQVPGVPEQVINIPTVRYTLVHTSLAAIAQMCCAGETIPAGTTVRFWSVTPPHPLNRLRNITASLSQPDGTPLRPGLYWLDATTRGDIAGLRPGAPTPESDEMIVAASVGVTMKTADNGTLAWVTCARTGKPLAGVTVRLLDYQANTAATGTTDARGLYRFSPQQRGSGVVLLVDDPHATACGGQGLYGLAEPNWTPGDTSPDLLHQVWAGGAVRCSPFGVRVAVGYLGPPCGPGTQQSGGSYLYTDRPIYRPGQTVRFRGVLWNNNDGVYGPLPYGAVNIRASDGNGRQVYRTRLTLDRFGAISGSFRLPATAFTGSGDISGWFDNGPSFDATFTVAEYRKPEFLATVTTTRNAYIRGQTLAATASVRYVFGAPVVRQPVSWKAYAQPSFPQPPGWDGYSFVNWEQLWQSDPFGPPAATSQLGTLVASGRGLTDAQGNISIRIPVGALRGPNGEQLTANSTVTLEVTSTDLSHQNVSARATVSEYRSNLAIGLAGEAQVTPAGKPLRVDVAEVSQAGAALPGQTLTARIFRRTYTSTLVTTRVGGQQITAWQPVAHDTPLATQTLTADSGGKATLTFTPAAGGEYVVAVSGTDAAGNPASNSLSVYASGAGFSDWGLSSDTSIAVRPDRASYNVGDTAHLLVAAPFDNATALVTVERGTIRATRVLQLAGNSPQIDVPITLGDISNVYVSVTIYRGWRNGSPPDWRTGLAELHVNVDPRHITVRLAQSAAKYHPGDPVTYTVNTTDSHGRPVSAELSLALVDTAVLALQDESNADILAAFYAEQPLLVSTASEGIVSIDHLQAQPDFQIHPPPNGPGIQYGSAVPPHAGGVRAVPSVGGGGCGACAPAQRPTLRSRFADTAYWAGAVVTDASGHATVHLTLPDNATTWRLDARGVTTGQAVGQAQLDSLATQDLVIRPVLPRFFLQGQPVRLGAIVNNNLGRPVVVMVRAMGCGLWAVGLGSCAQLAASSSQLKPHGSQLTAHSSRLTAHSPQLTAHGSQPVAIPPHGERLLTWRATVGNGAAARFMVRATPVTGGVRGDAVLTTVPVHPPLTDETVATSGQVYGGARQMIVVPRGAVSSPGELTVQVSASLVAGLGAAYAQLKPQPYESNQDIADRLLAAGSLRSLPRSITGLAPAQWRTLPGDIARDVAKLLVRQYPDGGWPWFNDPFEPSDPAITAGVLQGLQASGRQGPAVRQAIAAGRNYLINQLSGAAPVERAHLLLVLTQLGFKPLKSAMSLYGSSIQRLHLALAPLADLGRALAGLRASGRAQSIVSALDSQAVVSATGAHWEDPLQSGWGQPPTGTTAEVLATLVALSPHDPFAPAAARWLMLARQGPSWDCAHDTAEAIAALAAYARAAHEGTADYHYRVALNGAGRLAGRYSPTDQRAGAGFRQAISRLRRGAPNNLDISRGLPDGSLGRGPLYWVARLHYWLPANAIPALDEGLRVSRRYLDLRNRTITSAAAGAAVKVQLTIHTDQTLLYLDVEDPIPVGLEPIDSSLNTSQQGLFGRPPFFPFGSGTQDLTWYLQHSDLHDDRVSLYAYSLPPGTYTYTYLAQATIPGTYGVPPTHAQETFFPEVFGRSAGQSFRVR